MRQEDAAAAEAAATEAAPTNEVADAASGLWEKVSSGQFDQLTGAEIWTVAQPIVVAIVMIILVLMISGWARRLTIKAMTKARIEITLAKFFGNLAKWAIMLMGGITILGQFGVEATSFAAVIAALGFAVGMALSGTLGNVAAGVMLLVFRPYKVGDVISVNGVTAKVEEIELFTTTFDTPDNRRIIMPNGAIFGSTIENISHHGTRRCDVAVGTAYEADIDKAREVIERVAKSVEGGLADPGPVVYLVELGGSSIDWSIRVWCNAADYWAVRERLTRNVKVALDEAGIGIPYPQTDLHVPESIEVKVSNG